MNRTTMCYYLAIFCILVTSNAFSWGNATHMYFAKQLGAKIGPANFNGMYGSVLPDAFNFIFDANGQYLYAQTHENFQPFYTLASNHHLKLVASGFVSHNQLFGGDWTAHINGFTSDQGYAAEKGVALAPSLIPTLITIMTDAGLDPYTSEAIANGIAPSLGHDLSETAVDLLVRRNIDRAIGLRMHLASQARHKDVPFLLSAAYAQGLADFSGMSKEDASVMIIGAEKEFRKYIMQYGQAFMLPESQTIGLLAAQTAPIAKMYIEAATGYAVTVTVTPEQVAYFISDAITNVQPDYAGELSQTLAHLRSVMEPYGAKQFACLRGETAPATGLNEPVPAEFSLGQNYPNPFNPTTSVGYTLPSAAHVTLKIYNSLGQEVATLADNEQSAGEHIATWNAADLPSGVYIYRLNAGGYSATKQLTLVK